MNWFRRLRWLYKCQKLIRRGCPLWSFSTRWEYAETLHQTYVVDGDEDCTPEAALAEDMTYWGDL